MNQNTEIHIQKLTQYLEREDVEKALDYLAALPPKERGHWEIENIAGIICSYCGQYKEAISFFRSALKQHPDTPDLYYNLADVYFSAGEYIRAELMLKCCEHLTDDAPLLSEIADMRKELLKIYENNPSLKKSCPLWMIAYYFPPLSGSGVFRSLKFAKYLPEFYWTPTVISTDIPPKDWNFRDDTLMKELPKEINVIRIPDGASTQTQTVLSRDRARKMLELLKNVFQQDREAMEIFSEMLKTEEGIQSLLFLLCSRLSWSLDVIQYLEDHVDISEIPMIYTTSGPDGAHLVGYYMKKTYGIPWVADYRDPWTDNPYRIADFSKPSFRLLFRLENILLRQADCNITVADSFIPLYQNHFRLPQERIAGITNGYDEDDFRNLNRNMEKTAKFTITYSGLLYTQHRNIAPVLAAIHHLIEQKKMNPEEICFRIAGTGHKQYNSQITENYGLENILTQTGYISHQEALQANLDSDMLLLLVGDEERFRPVFTGKFFDYLRSGKPILALAPTDGEVDRVLLYTGHGETFLSTQTQNIEQTILLEYTDWKNRTENKFLHSPMIKRYERKYLTMKLADLLFEAMKHPTDILEHSEAVYNDGYLRGGAAGNYHKHYTQSFYYPSWKFAMKYLLFLNRQISILEIGCGAGQFANMLLDYGFLNYRGFDYAAEGVALARKNNPEYAEKFFVADAFQTPEVTKTYDLIICFEVLEHIRKDLELLNRIPKGTKLLLSVPNFDDPYHVRYFLSEQEVLNRYRSVMKIYDITESKLSDCNCLYYIVGEKL